MINLNEAAVRLNLTSQNGLGVLAAVTDFLVDQQAGIDNARQFDDRLTNRFFMRLESRDSVNTVTLNRWRHDFNSVASQFDLTWRLDFASRPKRVLLMVSRFDHCLVDLIYRVRIGELPMKITAIVSNYPIEQFGGINFHDIPFYYLPVTPETKSAREAELLAIVNDTATDYVVLARYMQVLSDTFVRMLAGRCINVYHSFLPAFKGAKPYHQAHARGVKYIGATCHYVTSELDEGPIIEQEVVRVSHSDTPDDLVRKGRDVERQVLARGLRYICEDRVFLNGTTTVVFAD